MRSLSYPTSSGWLRPPPIELAAKLAEIFPGDLNHFQFTSGGAESNETSLKIARYYWWLKGKPEKVKIISRRMGYHGIAMGALAATGIPTYHEGFGPGAGLHPCQPALPVPHWRGLDRGRVRRQAGQGAGGDHRAEGADTIAAMIGEPVQGAGGVVGAARWLLGRRSADPRRSTTSCSSPTRSSAASAAPARCSACRQYGVQADIASFAKGITSGYIPLGGVAVSDEIFERMSSPDRMFMHGFTYSGHPVACAVGPAATSRSSRTRISPPTPQIGGVCAPRRTARTARRSRATSATSVARA